MADTPQTPSIDVREDGPLIVRGLGKLRLGDGTEIETDGLFALCRCGLSSNKPFCDGTHKRKGFSSARETGAPLDRERCTEGHSIGAADGPAAIEVERGGPYRVRGAIALSSDLQPPSREHYALCRCGASKNKPFCDGAHAETSFDE